MGSRGERLNNESFSLCRSEEHTSELQSRVNLVCRLLLEKEKVNPTLLTYINRLSDFLFVAARFENREEGDILWVPEEKG